jgi:hypothetical protein
LVDTLLAHERADAATEPSRDDELAAVTHKGWEKATGDGEFDPERPTIGSDIDIDPRLDLDRLRPFADSTLPIHRAVLRVALDPQDGRRFVKGAVYQGYLPIRLTVITVGSVSV